MEFWIGVVGVVMAVLGGFTSVHPPKERQSKIIVGTIFGVSGLVLLALLWIHTSDANKEKQETTQVQQETRATLVQSQKEFRELRGAVENAQRELNKPGQANEKLDRVNERLGKALGKPIPTISPIASSLPSVVPVTTIHFDGAVNLKAGTQRLSDVLLSGGYSGSASLVELTICNKVNELSVYRGGTNVDDKGHGFEIEQGACDTERASGQGDVIDANQLYLFSRKPGTLSVTVRGLK